jgi:hypothetical protein
MSVRIAVTKNTWEPTPSRAGSDARQDFLKTRRVDRVTIAGGMSEGNKSPMDLIEDFLLSDPRQAASTRERALVILLKVVVCLTIFVAVVGAIVLGYMAVMLVYGAVVTFVFNHLLGVVICVAILCAWVALRSRRQGHNSP